MPHKVTFGCWLLSFSKRNWCKNVSFEEFFSLFIEKGVQRYNVCTEVYAGPYPFSEPEVAALSDLVEYYRERTALYVSLHAFSQVILSPYGYSSGKSPDYVHHVSGASFPWRNRFFRGSSPRNPSSEASPRNPSFEASPQNPSSEASP